MSRIRLGAIGIGARLSRLLSDMLRRHEETVELRAISDESGGAIEFASHLFPDTVETYTDHTQLLEDSEIDWVLIGSKNYLHTRHCLDAFAADKHVFCEKPLAISIDECEQIRHAHQHSGKLFATGFVLRYAPLYQKIYEIVQQGKLGRIVSLEANENLSADHGSYIMRSWRRHRKQSGPHILEKCSHDIDLLYWMVDSVPSKVASFGGLNIFTPYNKGIVGKLARPHDEPPLYQGWIAWEDVDPFTSEKDIEDNQVAIMEYRNGVRATFHTNANAAFPQRRMLICGLEGTLEADLSAGNVKFVRIGRNVVEEQYHFDSSDLHGGADPLIVDDLIHCMITEDYPKASGEEGFVSSITCLAIDEALKKSQIIDVEPYWERFSI